MELTLKNFQVTSGKVMVTDPCYNRSIVKRSGNHDIKAKIGNWIAVAVPSKYGCVSRLVAIHENYFDDVMFASLINRNVPIPINYKQMNDVDVDSGQAGIFDSEIYPHEDITGDARDLNTFYGKACKGIMEGNEDFFDIVDDRGVVSRTCYGDGSYSAYVLQNQNHEAVVFVIEFEDQSELNFHLDLAHF